MDNTWITFVTVSLLAITLGSCSGGGSNADDDDATLIPPLEPIPEVDRLPASVSGSGAITSVFNGYVLTSVNQYDESGSFASVNYYSLNSEIQSITRSSSSNENTALEDALLRDTTALNISGMPSMRSGYDFQGNLQWTETFEYHSREVLLARTVTAEFNGSANTIEYDYSSAGQLLTEKSVNPVFGTTDSNTDYVYSSNGLLEQSTSYFPALQPIEVTDYTHDDQNRLSGWTKTNFISDDTSTGSFTWDETGNLALVERFDSSGAQVRRIEYGYSRVDTNAYNKILYDLVYGPGGF